MNQLRRFILSMTLLVLPIAPLAVARAQDGAKAPVRRQFARGIHAGLMSAPLITIALKHKSELNLSADQVANLEKIKEHYQSQVTPLQQQLMANEKEIATLTEQSPANLIQIKSKIQDGEKYRSELRYMRIEALENGKSVLTAAQQDQLKTLVHSRRGHFGATRGQSS